MHLLYFILVVATIAAGDDGKRKTDESETLQNASSASVPREIPIGLPESGTGSSIVEDGLILTHAIVRDYFHWAGGNSYSTIRMMGLTESIIRTGAEYALIELVFTADNAKQLEKLEELDLPAPEDGTILVKRKILPGRSVCSAWRVTQGKARSAATPSSAMIISRVKSFLCGP